MPTPSTFKSLDATLAHAEEALKDAQEYSAAMAKELGRGLSRTGGAPEFSLVAEWCHQERLGLPLQSALEASAPELLAMLKAANHALYVVGKPSALKAALAGSAALIRKAEGRA